MGWDGDITGGVPPPAAKVQGQRQKNFGSFYVRNCASVPYNNINVTNCHWLLWGQIYNFNPHLLTLGQTLTTTSNIGQLTPWPRGSAATE